MRLETVDKVMAMVEGKTIYSFKDNKTLRDDYHWTGYGRGFCPSEIYFYEAEYGWNVISVRDKRVYVEGFDYNPNFTGGTYEHMSRRDARLSFNLNTECEVIEAEVFKQMIEPHFDKPEVEFHPGDIVAIKNYANLINTNIRKRGYTYPHHTRRLNRDVVLAWYAVKNEDGWTYQQWEKDKTWQKQEYGDWLDLKLMEMLQDGNATLVEDKKQFEKLIAKSMLVEVSSNGS